MSGKFILGRAAMLAISVACTVPGDLYGSISPTNPNIGNLDGQRLDPAKAKPHIMMRIPALLGEACQL